MHLKKILLFAPFLLLTACGIPLLSKKGGQQPHYIELSTSYGSSIIRLYDETPLHRDNMLKLVRDGFYDSLLFHRVIENFMIQGGDPNSKDAAPGERLGEGEAPGPRIPAEFRDSLFHKKGVLAAARDNNPEKASSNCQFYIVQGQVFTDEQLDMLEQTRLEGREIPQWQREVYKTIGGTPHLDQTYTVFGEVVQGLAMIDTIAAVETDSFDRPEKDVKMTIRELTRREVRRLEYEDNQL
ncbi:peptidyl-prolyl cis-trans isomerase B (cyclophilin B) [Anseongella ginsenosidimutans]|uniref:peptidylprolyl isomerase n=1 Tax=Anseongella ginsenosidimutans TaxID=496056 RepID=A0A4R3KVX2_9SPHI|nr:peptidylprolyl isomerase [Anseongella ginsenosidimutans]TCS89877.1 peptidyl-prolyl cis-trans isomerase B (cyclophilin B) [Anseongella ginsenosidimutans]